MDDVRAVAADLADLNSATEKDFLNVAGSLTRFLSASQRLHANISELIALVSSDQAQEACAALIAVRAYAREMQSRSDQGGRSLLILQTGAERLRAGFSNFGQIASSFRVTAILARMEAAQLATAEQNLRSLADDVRSCSDGIRARADQVLTVAAFFDSRVAATLREAARFEATQREELPSLLAAVDQDVETFRTRQREAVEGSAHLAAILDSVTGKLGGVAHSLQFHDITRQQVEHVIGTLEGLVRNSADGEISSSEAALIALQKAQLESAAEAFARSTSGVDRDLEGVAEEVARMAASSASIYGLAHKQEDSFLEGMHGRFTAISRAVAELQARECANRGVVADLEQAATDVGTAVHEVGLIEQQLNHISINAMASAIHIGSQGGAALKVIAGAIRELRAESAARSGGAGAVLHSIGGAIHSLAAKDADASGAALVQHLDERVRDLESAGQAGGRAAAKIAALAGSLRGNLQQVRDRFEAGRLFARTVHRCCESLRGVASRAEPLDSSGTPIAGAMEHLYTMEAQRNTHLAVLGGLPAGPADEHPDNVEFF
jgi:hypothetical protein